MEKFTCCFTGHRNLPVAKIEKIVSNLDREIENLIAKGVTDFISGGALGFDYAQCREMQSELRRGIQAQTFSSKHFT